LAKIDEEYSTTIEEERKQFDSKLKTDSIDHINRYIALIKNQN